MEAFYDIKLAAAEFGQCGVIQNCFGSTAG